METNPNSFIARLDGSNHTIMLADSCDDHNEGPKTVGAAVVIEHHQSPVEAMDTQEG